MVWFWNNLLCLLLSDWNLIFCLISLILSVLWLRFHFLMRISLQFKCLWFLKNYLWKTLKDFFLIRTWLLFDWSLLFLWYFYTFLSMNHNTNSFVNVPLHKLSERLAFFLWIVDVYSIDCYFIEFLLLNHRAYLSFNFIQNLRQFVELRVLRYEIFLIAKLQDNDRSILPRKEND